MSTDLPDPLKSLAGKTPQPRAEAKKRALSAAMVAFEAAKARETAPATQGNPAGSRLRSIISSLKRISIMDMRIPVGTAALALILLPLGYQLYSSTAMTQGESRARIVTPALEEPAVAPPPTAASVNIEPAQTQAPPPDALSQDMVQFEAPPMPAAPMEPQLLTRAPLSATMPAPMPSMTAVPSGDSFTSFAEQRLKVAAEEPVSTFSIDVDTASYSYVRRALEDGFLPEPDAVRIEEMINYFPYDYAPAPSAEQPFQPTIAVYPTPWNARTQLLQIGIKGYVPPVGEDKPSNLVFLIDTSGSMDEPDKLPLLKRAFGLLVDQLSANDTISIVAYAGSAGVVLEQTTADDKVAILQALDNLGAGGSTAGAEGIELAYSLANQHLVEGGINRVILATDGDFNVGLDDPADLKTFIETRAEAGISLSVLGFGRGNLDDATMQALAQNGNGNASYISSFREAQKVLVEEMGGTLQTIAQDVKIQVEFNPAVIGEYRLIGYETRALNREDFNNDAVDAGDIGAGHTVTALYEITPAGSDGALVDPLRYGTAATPAGTDELAFLRMRFKLPGSATSQLIEQAVTPSVVYGDISEVSDDMRFAAAVAAFGQKLKGSAYAGEMRWAAIAALAQSAKGADENGYRAEFVQLVKAARLLND